MSSQGICVFEHFTAMHTVDLEFHKENIRQYT